MEERWPFQGGREREKQKRFRVEKVGACLRTRRKGCEATGSSKDS